MRDPHPGRGGADALRAGVRVRFTDASPAATRLSDPFCTREKERPWVVAKWAQTLDGPSRRAGDSKWISGDVRALVHRWRGRVDAILTGVGTVLADDPLLTARAKRPPRRVALRVVVDPSLRTPPGSNLVRTARETPVLALCSEEASRSLDADTLRSLGVGVMPIGADPRDAARLDLREALRRLALERDCTNVLVESGPGLLSSLLADGLVDEARVFVCPVLLGDRGAVPAFDLAPVERLSQARRVETVAVARHGDDALLRLRFG